MPSESQKVVLITGASSGLGEAIAISCARAGHRVALAARRIDRIEDLARRIDRPLDTLALQTDMKNPEDIFRMAAATLEEFGRIDALIANAGVGHGGPFATSSEQQMLEQLDVNLLGVMRCVHQVLPTMIARGSGHILTVASVAAEIPSPRGAVYAATKAGVLAFSEGLRREVRANGIHVTTIIPGFVRSEMTADVPIEMPPASIVGDAVVELLRSPRARAVIPRYYGAAIWANRFAPWMVDMALAFLQKDLDRRARADRP